MGPQPGSSVAPPIGSAPVRFGTDGVRGDAQRVLTVPVMVTLAQAGAEILGSAGFAVGRDTRESGTQLAAAVHAGVSAAGATSVDLGVVPTPAVALWCRTSNSAGAMVSASHNPWHDNGIKFFDRGGTKLHRRMQQRIQARFEELWQAPRPTRVSVPSTGLVANNHDEAFGAHLNAVTSMVAPDALQGLTVVVDAANGAACEIAPRALARLGAEVVVTHANPDGRNINARCGSTHPESLQKAVTAAGADAGVAFDGDADRVVAVDHTGEIVDGDQIMAICALEAFSRGELTGNAVVVTALTNQGFRQAMKTAGIGVVDTEVGDQNVLEALDEHGLILGGEQSGHVIFRDLSAGGDGLQTAVKLLNIVASSGRRLETLASESMTRLPQVSVNVAVQDVPADLDARIASLVAAAGDRLAGRGRVLVRASGTEPVMRVMVEASTAAEAAMEAEAMAAVVAGVVGKPR